MVPVSAVVLTLNEERNVAAALESVAFCDEVVVVDAGSTDRTREIAEAAGARVVLSTPWPGFTVQRNRATEEARHDWILAVDADERVTPALRHQIDVERARGFVHAGYQIPRIAYYLGRWIRGTDWYPDRQLRLFDRRRGRWVGALIHESVKVQGTVGRLDAELHHLPYADLGHHLRTIDTYTTLWAQQAFAEGARARALTPLANSAWAFLRNYLLRRGFMLGETGLTVSVLNSYYTYAKLAKLQELARNAAG